jgi:F0F1-type ATP synthase assembly protein I
MLKIQNAFVNHKLACSLVKSSRQAVVCRRCGLVLLGEICQRNFLPTVDDGGPIRTISRRRSLDVLTSTMTDTPNPLPKPRDVRLYALGSQIGLEMVGPVLLGAFIDWWAQTLPWFTVGGVLLGLTVAMWRLTKLANQLGEPSAPPPPP